MTRTLLVLRPEPGASVTAGRARQLRLEVCVAPLFTVRPMAWEPPHPQAYDAWMLTSANAPRLAGAALTRYAALPLYVVGNATAEAARARGLHPIWTGEADAASLASAAAAAGVRRMLHLCGREYRSSPEGTVMIDHRVVYAADAREALDRDAVAAMRGGGVALLHSPRAARLFAALADQAGLTRESLHVAALSPAVAAAAGEGWGSVGTAAMPEDAALLAVAARMCE